MSKEKTIEETATEIVKSIFGAERAGSEYDYVVKALTERDHLAYERGREFERERIESAYEKYCNHDIDLEEFEQTLTNQ